MSEDEIDTSYDIPTVGKYNRRGKVFLDRTAAKILTPVEKQLVITHEKVEHRLRTQHGMSYHDAHAEAERIFPWGADLKDKLHRLAGRVQRLSDSARKTPPSGVLMNGATPETEFGLTKEVLSRPGFDPIRNLTESEPVRNLSEKGSDVFKALRLSGQPYEEKTIVSGFEQHRLIKPMTCTKCKKVYNVGDLVLRHESGRKFCPVCGGEVTNV